MARVPDEAIRRRREVTAGAWHLYELYCLHRHSATGLCNPSNTTLAAEMRSSYTHISDCKTELVKKRWIEREGRHRVKLLVGEFAPLKVRDLASRTSENSELQLRNIPNFGAPNFGEFRTSTSEYSELQAPPPITPYKDLTSCIEPVAAAAAAAEPKDFRKEPADDAFCKAIVEARLYPPDLVEFVKHKLNFRCAQEGVEPTKGRLLYWLSIEREDPIQRALPTMQSDQTTEVVQGNFDKRRPTNPNLLQPKPDCQLCHGAGLPNRYCDCQICGFCFATGMEISDQEAKRCRHLSTQTETEKRSAEAG